jgi:peptidoglycan/LPS O-acetylase OafA/YrhL
MSALTSLRIFAAMHVVMCHVSLVLLYRSANHWVAATQNAGLPAQGAARIFGLGTANVMAAGPWSVSLFFVLSGFILTQNYLVDQSKPLNVRKFWIARFARIYPLYILALVLTAPFELHGAFVAHNTTPAHLLAGGALVVTLLQAWFPHYALAWNPPAWSLSDEVFFYAMFPLLALVFRRCCTARAATIIVLACWGISLVLSAFFWPTYDGHYPWPGGAQMDLAYSPICRLPEFFAGMALGKLLLSRGGVITRWPSLLAIFAGGALIILAGLGEHCPRILTGPGCLMPLYVLLIAALADSSGRLARMMSWWPLVFFGEVSYAIYLIHVPLSRWFGMVLHHLFSNLSTDPREFKVPNYPSLIVFIVLLLMFTAAVYRRFEMPMRDKVRRSLGRWFGVAPSMRPETAEAAAALTPP